MARKKGRTGNGNGAGDGGVRAVDRALDILLAFNPGDHELSVADLQKRVKLSRPTLYRLLHTLEQNRFLASGGDPKRFRLGAAVAQLAHVWSASLNVSALAEPMMRRIWTETGETVALFVRDGLYRVCVAEIPSAQVLSFKRGVGYRDLLAQGASGRIILAQMQPDAAALKLYASVIDGNCADYLKGLAQVRAQGFAVSHDELIHGAVAVAAPFFDARGEVAGSLGVFGPSVRFPQVQADRYGQLLVREAAQLSRALGSPGARPQNK